MYLFEADYLECRCGRTENVTIPIEVDSQIFDTEKEIYTHAMSKAYDLIEKDREFCSLTLIGY